MASASEKGNDPLRKKTVIHFSMLHYLNFCKKQKRTSAAKKSSVKQLIKYVLLFTLFPVVINFLMKIGFRDGIFSAEGDRQTWILFWGSLLGGALTLAGVYFTLQHNRRMHIKSADSQLLKEKLQATRSFITANLNKLSGMETLAVFPLPYDNSVAEWDNVSRLLNMKINDYMILSTSVSLLIPEDSELAKSFNNLVLEYYNHTGRLSAGLDKIIKNKPITEESHMEMKRMVSDYTDQLSSIFSEHSHIIIRETKGYINRVEEKIKDV